LIEEKKPVAREIRADVGHIDERLDDLARAFTRLSREVTELRKNGNGGNG
jgi:hypothetical protein